MSLTEVHHKSLAGINKLPADLWWAWLKFITNHWLGLTSCQLICDEPEWSSSQITGWDWKVASWFVMNLTEVHHKSLAGINKLPADLWWTWLKFITNHWLGLTSCQLICDEPARSSSQITGWGWKVASWFAMNLSQVHRKSFDLFWERFCDEKVANWLKSCRRYVCTHVPVCWWVHAVCVCVFNLAGGCTHPLF